MSEPAIAARGLGKMYRLYRRPVDRVLDVFGLAGLAFWRPPAFREFWALRDLDLTIARGERVGIIGRNGAGKSTLLKLIAGTVAPTEGRLAVAGQVQALMELGTGFHPEFTGRENIRAALAFQGLDGVEAREREEEIVDFSELEDVIDQPVRAYSAGMYARLAFSTATAIRPQILIVDEVLGAGDAYFTGKCMGRMKDLAAGKDVTVLYVSHDIGSVQQLCTRAVWIERGQVREDGDTVAVVKAYYRSVQREEALRRQALASGIRKKRNLAEMEAELDRRAVFHLRADGGVRARHAVRRIELRRDGEVLCAASVGAPMDNAPQAPLRIVDDPGFMDWSPPQRDAGGYFRHYGPFGGSYGHAPFEVALAGEDFPSPRYALVVDGEIAGGDRVRVELFAGGAYHRVGELREGGGPQTFTLPAIAPEGGEPGRAGPSEMLELRVRVIAPADGMLRMVAATLAGGADGDRPLVAVAGEGASEIDGAFRFEPGGGEVRLALQADALAAGAVPMVDYRYEGGAGEWAVRAQLPGRSVLVHRQALVEGQGRVQWPGLAALLGLDADPESRSVVTWTRPDPRIERVRLLDASGEEVAGIEELQDLVVEIAYTATRAVTDPVFSMSILQASGALFCHANTALAGLRLGTVRGHGAVRFEFPCFRGTAGDYLLGAGMFHYLDPMHHSGQPPYYDQHDRAYRFRVWRKMDNAMDLGMARLEFRARHLPGMAGD